MTVRSSAYVTVLAVLAMLAGLLAGPVGATDGGADRNEATDEMHAEAFAALEAAGILAGTECDRWDFCPDEPLQNWVLAVWLVRAIDGQDPAEVSWTRFEDVDVDLAWLSHIERFADFNVVEGCGFDPLRLCPDQVMTRSQAARVLARAFELPPAGDAEFVDLEGVSNAGDINALAAAGITVGCSVEPLLYCPDAQVTRGHMATFLFRALGLTPVPPYEPATDPTPLTTDPSVRVGTLENGLTYYLRHNDRPGKSVTMRLAIGAGSVNESEPGQGYAHFLEHVLFEGTEAYTAESLNSTLRNLGAELGPDTNAYVGYDQTVFELTVASDPPENVATALHVLSQMAHAATIDPEGVVAERGVVLDELRFRQATSYGYVGAEFDRIYTKGTPYEGRHPGGTAEAIEATTAEDLRTFYETWYVPSNMAIIAVGDLSVDELQALVEEHFGSIPGGDAPPFSLPEVTPNPEGTYYVVTDEGQGFSYISLDIPIPTSESGTVGGQRLLVMERLIRLMVLNRLEDAYYRGELTQVDRPDFTTFNHGHALRFYGTNWQGDDLDTASAAYFSVLLTAQEYGFTDADVVRARDEMTAALKHELESAVTTTDPQYADTYVSHFLFGADIRAPQDRHDRLSAILETITARELTKHYRWLMNRAGPIVIAVGPDPASVPTTADLEAAFDAAAPRSEPPPVEEDIDELMPLPDPVEPVASGLIEVLDGFEWEFANGARVVFVYSDIVEATVNLQARALGGWSTLEPGARALSPRAVEAVVGSGFGDLSKPQINRFLGETTVSLSASIGERTEGFDGGANRDDLETLFQLMHLLVTAPRVDELAFDQALNSAAIRTQLAEVNPAWQAWVAYNEARFGLEWYRPVATREQLASMSAESLLDLYTRRLGDVDDMVVAVVGDVDAGVIERLARHYIGTLPAGESDTYVDRHRPAPTGVVRREIAISEDESAVMEMSYETQIAVTPSLRVNAHMLRVILGDRLFRLVREELGASYVTQVSISPALAPRPTVYSDIAFTVDADRLDDAHARVLSILADLVANGPTSEELEQAKAVAQADYDKASNARLLRVLTNRLHTDDDNLLMPERSLEELGKVTAATVQALAAEIYDTEDRIEIVRIPTPPTEESS